MKSVSSMIAIALAASMLASCSFFPQSDEDKLLEEYDPIIREYLADKYGEELSENVKIRVEDLEEKIFEVSTPILKYDGTFEVRPDPMDKRNEELTDSLLSTFVLDEDFRRDYFAYVHDKLGLPEDIDVTQLELQGFDFDGYKAGDDYMSRFETADSKVMIVTWVIDGYDREQAPSYVEEFYNEYWPLFEENHQEGESLVVYFDDVRNAPGDVRNEVIYYSDEGYWGGPDVILYECTGSGIERVDEYYFR